MPPHELDRFMDEVVSFAWHAQHDEGRAFADTSAELIARHPEHAELIAMWRPRFSETLTPVPGMREIVEALDAAGAPLFAITNFSHEFWPPFVRREAGLFDRFRGIVVSGEERVAKPDPAIFALAMRRFGLAPGEALFVDDRAENVAAGEAAGLVGHVFRGADTLRVALTRAGLLGG